MGEPAGPAPGNPEALGDWGLGPTPPGHRHFQRRIQLAAAFDAADPGLNRVLERARALLNAWGPQVGAGMRVEGAGVPPAVPEVGVEAVLRMRLAGVLPIAAPVRVIWTVDTPERGGFAYEALPGHVEAGRESFVVTRATSPEGVAEVWFTVTAYSRPALWYARMAAPVARPPGALVRADGRAGGPPRAEPDHRPLPAGHGGRGALSAPAPPCRRCAVRLSRSSPRRSSRLRRPRRRSAAPARHPFGRRHSPPPRRSASRCRRARPGRSRARRTPPSGGRPRRCRRRRGSGTRNGP